MLHEGSCLCDEVKFEIDGEFENFYLCHYKRIRRMRRNHKTCKGIWDD